MKLEEKAKLSRALKSYQEGWRDGFKDETRQQTGPDKNAPWFPMMYKLGYRQGREARKELVSL